MKGIVRIDSRFGVALRKLRYEVQIRSGRFLSPEPDLHFVGQHLRHGDWVIDVGANVGHYTKRFSDLVGCNGRVIAFEPVPVTFEILASNASHFATRNVTLINMAASDTSAESRFVVPSTNGHQNYYQAHIAKVGDESSLSILTVPIDSLELPSRVALVKIDAEGHEGAVLRGMRTLLRRDRPLLIVEGGARDAIEIIHDLGYSSSSLAGSPNVIYQR